jgi:hypothetical protein
VFPNDVGIRSFLLEHRPSPASSLARHHTIDDASHDLEQLSGLWLIGPDLGDPEDAAKNDHPSPLMKILTGSWASLMLILPNLPLRQRQGNVTLHCRTF